MQEMQEKWVWHLGQEDPLEKEMETHPSILAWEVPWTEEPGKLQSMGLQRGGYNWMTKHSFREYISDDLKQSSPIRELKVILEAFS